MFRKTIKVSQKDIVYWKIFFTIDDDDTNFYFVIVFIMIVILLMILIILVMIAHVGWARSSQEHNVQQCDGGEH